MLSSSDRIAFRYEEGMIPKRIFLLLRVIHGILEEAWAKLGRTGLNPNETSPPGILCSCC
jgi:hypothetical protein